MRLKSFHGTTMTEAMRHVREALGDNAIIVATRDDEMGGVRVTAAIDDEPPARAVTNTTTTASVPVLPREPEGTEAIEKIADALARHQIPISISERLLAAATQFANDDPVLALGAAFDTHFKFLPITDEKPGKPLILIGPAGAGKTLCIAKFATKATLAKRPATVVSTDFERAGGLEQLAAFTRLPKVNLVEIEDAHALRELIAMQPHSHLFIDTAGGNPFNASELKTISGLVTACGGEAVLVMPAGMDVSEALDMAEAFQKVGANRLLVTRVDVARRLGSVLSMSYETKLPLANYNASGSVTEAPLPLNPVALARLVLYGAEQKNQKPEPAAAVKAGW